MDRNQQSDNDVAKTESTSSRRVMWKAFDGEEEVYDSIVNYRRLTPPHNLKHTSSSNSDYDQPTTSKPSAISQPVTENEQQGSMDVVNKSSTNLALRYKPSHESIKDLAGSKRARAIGCWHYLFERIRSKKVELEISPGLALRYKPSHESIKNRRSKDEVSVQSATRSTNSPKPKLTADVKLEIGLIPPSQTVVVRGPAPKFANRVCELDDSDSCCSGTLELRIPLRKSTKSKKAKSDHALHETTSSSNERAPKNGNTKFKRRNKQNAGSSPENSKGNADKTISTGNSNKSMPTLRQRQLELHRVRVLIEKRRLELLDLKIVRERADALRHEILFHKDLQLKHNQMKAFEDNNSSQA